MSLFCVQNMANRKTARVEANPGLVLDQARHYMRFLRVERGEKPAAVAKSEGVTVRAIEKSIRTVELQRGIYTQSSLNMALIGMLLGKVAKADRTFDRMLEAKDYIEKKNVDGSTEFIPVDDKATQIRALEVLGKYAESMQPKGGGVSVKVQQNNANQANATTSGTGGYESMLHRIIKESQQHNQLPSETADVIDAEEFGAEDDEDDDEVMTA